MINVCTLAGLLECRHRLDGYCPRCAAFDSAGYVALFEIDGPGYVSILAVPHQREENYH